MNSISKNIFYKLSILLIVLSSLSYSKDALIVKKNRPGSLILELSVDSLWYSADKKQIFTSPILDLFQEPNNPRLPYFKEVLIGVPANANIKVYKSDKSEIGKYKPIIQKEDFPKLENIEPTTDKEFDGIFPTNIVELAPTIDIYGKTSSLIKIFPVEVNSGTLSLIQNITVQISWETSSDAETPLLLSKSNINEIRPRKQKLKKEVSFSIPDYQYSNNLVKIVVDTTSWFGITQDALVDSGVDINKIDPATIRLWNKEDEVLIFIEGDEDGSFDKDDQIIFYGKKAPSPDSAVFDNNFYTNDNVYWLTWGGEQGRRYMTESVFPTLPSHQVYHPQNGTYRYTKKIERDDILLRLRDVNIDEQWDIMDHFFMTPSIHPGETVHFPFVLPKPDKSTNSTFDITVNVQGVSRNNHNVDIKINDRITTSGEWFGQNSFEIISDPNNSYESSFLNNGENQISLDLSGDSPDQRFDNIYLNWFEITYDKLYSAFSDYIKFSRDKSLAITTQFSVDGFTSSDIFLFKEGVSRLRDFIVDETSEDRYEILFQDFYGENSPSYYAFTRNQLNSVKSITTVLPIINLLRDIQKSYITISPDSYRAILDPLVDLHDGIIVDVDDVYRQYSYGILSPYGIKSFLQDVYYKNEKLKYVLLGMQNNNYYSGGDSFFASNYIPSMKIIVKEFGAAISDYWYACLDDDLFPEIAVGRFPASNKNELEQIVDKSINHINRDSNTWDNNILFVGGLEEDFKDQSELLLRGWADRGHFISRLYIDMYSEQTTFYGTTDTLLQHLNRGLSYINFVGHGGGAVWGDRSILGHSNIDDLDNNNKVPFVTSMTCFTGDYSIPNSLGREMLLAETGGALAWYGSSGKGWIGNDYLLIDPLNQLLYRQEDYTIGEMINLSKIQYYVSHSNITKRAKTQLFQYNLAGDPAIKLKKSLDVNPIATPSNPEPGEQIQVDFEESSVDSLYYQFFLDDYYSLNQPTFVGQASNLSYDLPDSLTKGDHRLNVGYKSGTNLLNNSILLAVQGSKIENMEVVPENPTYKDSIGVTAKVTDKNGINSVQILIDDIIWDNLVNVSGDIYELRNLIPPQTAGSSIRIKIRVVDGAGNETISSEIFISIYKIPNISPNKLYFSDDETISLIAEIENSVPAPTNVKAKLEIKTNGDWDSLGEKDIFFDGKEIKYVNFDGYFPNGENEYRIIANTSNNLSDTSDDTLLSVLPTEYFWVTNTSGTTFDGVNHSTVGNNKIKLSINPGSVEQSKIITIRYVNEVSIPSQPDFAVVEYNDVNNAVEIVWDSPSTYEVNWELPVSIIDPIRLYKYFNDYSTWLPQAYSTLSNNTIQFIGNGSGKYTFLTNTDVEPPIINATVNGQKYLANSYINDSPIFSFSIFDNNGIDFRLDSINIFINEKPVNDVITNTNGGAGNIGIEVSPVLLETDSTLSILFQDAAGNKADTVKIKFIVSTELKLIDYGNYPNPFIDNTKFAYELSETVEELSFIIYSVEGRKIRKLSSDESLTELDLRLGGYHELDWNGINNGGNIIGNGIYFYLIRAKIGGDVIEKTGKIIRAK